jgi:murein L,D-transpeptidase YcbB/YkuD
MISLRLRQSSSILAELAASAVMLVACPTIVLGQQTTEGTQAIGELFAKEAEALPLPIKQEAAALRRYYLDQSGRFLWTNSARIADLVATFRSAAEEGLEPSAYPADELSKVARFKFVTDRLTKAQTELYVSALFLRFARDLKVGRFLPTRIDPKLYWQRKTIDPVRALALMAKAQSTSAFIAKWQPRIAEYRRLKPVLAAYRELEAAGGWPTVSHGETVRPGESHPAVVPALHARLVMSDAELHGARDRTSTLYDPELVAATKRFQLRHGLEADGVIGKQTAFALNIPIKDRIQQIITTMERWRWMPEDLGQSHIMVNIAGYELRRVHDGKLEETMRVVVGKPYHQTPVFSDEIEYLVFNPYWNVPYSIAVKEELPKLKVNPAARAARGFEAVVDGRGVPLTSINWNAMSRGNFPVKIRQKPGPNNALGRVKFMLPNRFNVYLHDTPAHSLFSRAQRAFSHGCIRLARPIDLAEQVLQTKSGWQRGKIEQVLAGKNRTVVRLPQKLPVHLTYATVWLDQNGLVHFRPDIYGRDAKLEKALVGRYSSS